MLYLPQFCVLYLQRSFSFLFLGWCKFSLYTTPKERFTNNGWSNIKGFACSLHCLTTEHVQGKPNIHHMYITLKKEQQMLVFCLCPQLLPLSLEWPDTLIKDILTWELMWCCVMKVQATITADLDYFCNTEAFIITFRIQHSKCLTCWCQVCDGSSAFCAAILTISYKTNQDQNHPLFKNSWLIFKIKNFIYKILFEIIFLWLAQSTPI